MSIRRTIYLIVMTIILCIMTLGYAALQERVDVELEASIDSTYRVEITRVQEGTAVGYARSTQAPSYNDLTATFNVGLTNDTDYITYTIEITNYSTVDIRLNNTETTTTNNNIKVVKSGIRNGDIVLASSTKTVTIKVKLETATSSEQTGAITAMFDFTRLKGGLGEVVSNLPSNYQELEYIESTGTQYIDTDYIPKINTKIELDIKFSGSFNTTCTSIFSSNNRETSIFQLNFGGSGGQGNTLFPWNDKPFGKGGTDKSFNITNTIRENKNTIAMSNDLITYENVEGNLNPKTTDNDISLILFGNRRADNSICSFNAYNMYVYSLKLYEGETLVREYIPVLDNNNVPCMYELENDETFYNQGTGDFLYQLKE